VEPEVIKAGDRQFDDELAEQIAWLMDSSIQIGPASIGLDGLIGLIPGLGDVLTNIVSAVIVMRAMQNGVHRSAILRMVLNLAIDTAVGSVPVVGDIFDFAFKANTKNLRIYRESLSGTRKPLRDWGFILLIGVILLAMIVLPILGLIYLIQLIFSSLR
jgi:Domain of unknown function (DUF4112)